MIVLSSSEENNDVIEPSVTENPSPIPVVSQRPQQKKKMVPDYKIVDGTTFAVDAFRFGEIAGVTTYFLTHYHSDHYVGLNRKFNQPIYMSTITGKLTQKENRFRREMLIFVVF